MPATTYPNTTDWTSYLNSLKGSAGAGAAPSASTAAPQVPTLLPTGQYATPAAQGAVTYSQGPLLPQQAMASASTATPAPTDFASQWSELMKTINSQVAQPDLTGDPTAAANQAASVQQAYRGAMIPNYGNLQAGATDLISSQLAGQVSPSTRNTMAQGMAERGIGTGTAYGNLPNARYLQLLGQTSEGLQQQGFQNLSTITQLNSVDPAQFVITPYQRASIQTQLYDTTAKIASQLYEGNLDRQQQTTLELMKENSAVKLEQLHIQGQLQNTALDGNIRQALQMQSEANQIRLKQMEIEAELNMVGVNEQSASRLKAQQATYDSQLKAMDLNARAYENSLSRAQQEQLSALKESNDLQIKLATIQGTLQSRAIDNQTRISLAQQAADARIRIAEINAETRGFQTAFNSGYPMGGTTGGYGDEFAFQGTGGYPPMGAGDWGGETGMAVDPYAMLPDEAYFYGY